MLDALRRKADFATWATFLLLISCGPAPGHGPCSSYRNICDDQWDIGGQTPNFPPSAPGAAFEIIGNRIGLRISESHYDSYDRLYIYWYRNGKPLDAADDTVSVTDSDPRSGRWLVEIYAENIYGRGQPTEMTLDVGNAAHPLDIDTGQSACYDETTVLAACPITGSTYYGQDAQYGAVTRPVELTKTQGAVIDRRAGLMWEDPPTGEDTHCTNLDALGHDDWRLPLRDDWLSLIDLSSPGLPAQFEDRTAVLRTNDDYAVDLVTGLRVTLTNPRQRCVRPTKTWAWASTHEYAFTGAQTFTHFSTGLAWAAQNKTEAVTWRAALSYCENLVHESLTDWRLPNLFELASVTQLYGAFDLAFDKNVDNLRGRRFWTSTTVPRDPATAYQFLYNSGELGSRLKTKTGYVLCVRTDE